MTLDQIADAVVVLLTIAISAIASILWKHSGRLTHLEAISVPEDHIRNIMEREVDRLHDDFKEQRKEQREANEKLEMKIDQLREAFGTRSSDK